MLVPAAGVDARGGDEGVEFTPVSANCYHVVGSLATAKQCERKAKEDQVFCPALRTQINKDL